MAFAGIIVFGLAINTLLLILPLYAWQLLDRVLESRSQETLLALATIALLAAVTVALLEVLRTKLLHRSALRLEARFSSAALDAHLDRANHRDQNASPLFDVQTLRSTLDSTACASLTDLLFLPLLLGIVFLIHPTLAWITLMLVSTTLGLLLVMEVAHGGRAIIALKQTSLMDAENSAVLQDMDEARTMGLLPNVLRRRSNGMGEYLGLQVKAANHAAWANNTARLARLIGQIVVLGVAASLVLDNALSVGAMIAASLTADRALILPIKLRRCWGQLGTGWVAYRRLVKWLARSAAIETVRLPQPIGQISVEKMSYGFPGAQHEVLKNVAFALPPGETLALIGPSGSGKSTLAKLVAGVCQPSQGAVKLDSINLQVWCPTQLSEWVGYLPQQARLLEGTVRDNIARFSHNASHDDVTAAAKRGHVHQHILKLPYGYDTDVGKGGCLLSTAQRQYVALARCFFGDPRLLVLDDPSASMDPIGKQCLVRAVAEARRRGITLVMVSHYPDLLNQADKVLLLVDGKVTKFGPRGDVLAVAQPDASRQISPLKVVGGDAA